MKILGVDPGLGGAFCLFDGAKVYFEKAPLLMVGKDREIDFFGVRALLGQMKPDHVYLERAKPLAMGSKHAFNYGRGFQSLILAVELATLSYTLVEPHIWTKWAWEGIGKDFNSKAKSAVAAKRLFPAAFGQIPKTKSGKPHDGMVDALLIAGFGLWKRKAVSEIIEDFE